MRLEDYILQNKVVFLTMLNWSQFINRPGAKHLSPAERQLFLSLHNSLGTAKIRQSFINGLNKNTLTSWLQKLEQNNPSLYQLINSSHLKEAIDSWYRKAATEAERYASNRDRHRLFWQYYDKHKIEYEAEYRDTSQSQFGASNQQEKTPQILKDINRGFGHILINGVPMAQLRAGDDLAAKQFKNLTDLSDFLSQHLLCETKPHLKAILLQAAIAHLHQGGVLYTGFASAQRTCLENGYHLNASHEHLSRAVNLTAEKNSFGVHETNYCRMALNTQSGHTIAVENDYLARIESKLSVVASDKNYTIRSHGANIDIKDKTLSTILDKRNFFKRYFDWLKTLLGFGVSLKDCTNPEQGEVIAKSSPKP